jgi:hypothetical protein
MDKTCCPLYTIRCDTLNFQLRKSQKGTLKRVKNFLEKNELPNKSINKSREAEAKGSVGKSNDQNNNSTKVFNKLSNEYVLNKLKNRLNSRQTNARRVVNFFLDKKSNPPF